MKPEHLEAARLPALRAYWAATVGLDDADSPCPTLDDWTLMEPEDIGAVERMLPVVATLIAEHEALAAERMRERAAVTCENVVSIGDAEHYPARIAWPSGIEVRAIERAAAAIRALEVEK